MMSICPELPELASMLEGEISPERESELELHLRSCKPCRDELERLTNLPTLTLAEDSPESSAFWRGLSERLRKALRYDSSE